MTGQDDLQQQERCPTCDAGHDVRLVVAERESDRPYYCADSWHAPDAPTVQQKTNCAICGRADCTRTYPH